MYQKTEKYENNKKGNYYNIGWLINGDQFPTGTINEATLTKLFLLLARERINAMRSFEYCTLAKCNGQEVMHYHELAHLTGTYNQEHGGTQTLKQEIWLPSADGTKVFVAPSIILHYITDHKYLPPQEFLDAVDHFDFGGTWSGTAAREACLKQLYEKGEKSNDTQLPEIVLKTNNEDPGTGYIYLNGYPEKQAPHEVHKTVSLAELIKDYNSIPVYLDFDQNGALIGIEISGQ